jgi:hypothetical protein
MPEDQLGICIPAEVTLNDLMRVVVRYGEQHPEELDQRNFFSVIVALGTAYPCQTVTLRQSEAPSRVPYPGVGQTKSSVTIYKETVDRAETILATAGEGERLIRLERVTVADRVWYRIRKGCCLIGFVPENVWRTLVNQSLTTDSMKGEIVEDVITMPPDRVTAASTEGEKIYWYRGQCADGDGAIQYFYSKRDQEDSTDWLVVRVGAAVPPTRLALDLLVQT